MLGVATLLGESFRIPLVHKRIYSATTEGSFFSYYFDLMNSKPVPTKGKSVSTNATFEPARGPLKDWPLGVPTRPVLLL